MKQHGSENRKEQLCHRAVSLRQRGFLVFQNVRRASDAKDTRVT